MKLCITIDTALTGLLIVTFHLIRILPLLELSVTAIQPHLQVERAILCSTAILSLCLVPLACFFKGDNFSQPNCKMQTQADKAM